MASEYILRVENLHKKFGDREVLHGISFNVKPGDTKVFIGPSGTGKSTLLRCINQLE
ncbi:MAG: ATP-binding cassette domain-containing protein, partial [Methanoregula sp.]|nr:ATP-binding cassette domain-containing protein [Methanoregula sp.]